MNHKHEQDPFEALLASGADADEPTGEATAVPKRKLVKVTVAVAAVLCVGVGLFVGGPALSGMLAAKQDAPQTEAKVGESGNQGGSSQATPPEPADDDQPERAQAPQTGQKASPAAESGGPRVAELADSDWVSRASVATGIPERALTAYAGASIVLAEERPGCGIGWNTLAGIGEVETHHGSLGGSTITPAGVASPKIIGIPLDGNGVAAVPDTDGGELDGDPVWDRALGPMQFIPTTWKEWAADGTGDGQADVHRIDDAALAAGRYLCELGGDLTVQENWERAISGYNDSHDYAVRVSIATQYYATSTQPG